jgi:hypothetical protein
VPRIDVQRSQGAEQKDPFSSLVAGTGEPSQQIRGTDFSRREMDIPGSRVG